MLTSDVPTSETLSFIQAHAPAPARILEVGCGDGALAARLQEASYEVLAIDASEEAVTRARQRGVDARVARWPDFEDARFDVVLFTRSLHHIDPLSPAVARARSSVGAGGKVLVEDFAISEIETLASEWLYGQLMVLDAAGLIRREQHDFANELLRHEGSLEFWRAACEEHHLHTAETMLACLRGHFARVEVTIVPYLYRHVCAVLAESAVGFDIAERVLAMERRFASTARTSLIGRRYVCTGDDHG